MTLFGHEKEMTSVEFGAGVVLTSSPDGTTRLWPLDRLPLAKARKHRELTAAERRRYTLEAGR